MKNRLMRLLTLAALACCLLISGVLVACGGNTESKGAHIDVGNGTATAPLGEYEVPIPSVVDESGTVLSGYTVTVSSIKDAEGNDVEYVSGTIIVEEPAVITIVYAAEGVENATLVVTFESEAPKITFTDGGFPSVYLNGNTYYIPAFTAEGADASKTSVAVNYLATESSEPEKVAEDLYSGDPFTVKYGTGYYQFVIHVENKFGTGADYTYLVPLNGPAETVEGGVVYFEDPFGVEQVASEYGWLDFKYVEAKDLDETMMSTANDAMKAAKGLTHIVFDETLASTTPQAGFVLQNPAITGTGDYAYMYFDVYNAGDNVISMQLEWCSATTRALAPHAWTRVIIDLDAINKGALLHATSDDISGLVFYLAGGAADKGNSAETLKQADIDLYFGNILFGDTATQYVPAESEVKQDQVFYFNTPAGVDQIAYRSGISGNMPDGRYEFSYVSADTMTELKDETTGLSGATKILNNNSSKGSGGASGDFILAGSTITDVSEYAFIALRVYKPAGITGYIGYLREQGITGGGFTKYDLADGWNTVYLSTDHMGACTPYGGRQVNAVKLVIGGIKLNEALYFGGAFGIKDADLAVEKTLSDQTAELYPNQSYTPAKSLAVAVQDTCAVTWLRGETVANLTYTLSSVTDSTGAPVEVKDGAFVPATTGGTYTLTYSAAFNDGIKLYDYDVVEDVTGKVTVTITTTDPTLDWEAANLPGYYVGTVEYELPDYSVVGVVLDTDEVKVYSVPNEDSELTEDDLVAVSGNTFTVPNKAGYIVFKVTVTYGGGSQTKTFTSPYIPVEVYVEEEGVVAALDQAYGLMQADVYMSTSTMKFAYIPKAELGTEVTEGADIHSGVTKVTTATNGLNTLLVFRNLSIADFSGYSYFYMDVYNPNAVGVNVFVRFWNGCGEYLFLRPNGWTRLIYDIDALLDLSKLAFRNAEGTADEKRADYTNMEGLTFELAGLNTAGEGLYFGKAGVSAKVPVSGAETAPADKVFGFDSKDGLSQIVNRGGNFWGKLNVSFATWDEIGIEGDPEHSGEGTGMTKITATTVGTGAVGDFMFTAPYIADLSAYDKVAIRVYNPNDKEIVIGQLDAYLDGSGALHNKFTVPAKSWATAEFDIAELMSKAPLKPGYDTMESMRFVVQNAGNDCSVYLGAAYGVKADA